MAKATLLVIQGIDQGARFEFEAEALDVGRGYQNQIRIPDTEISRQHAVFEQKDGEFHIIDRGSSNGTFVNGKQIRAATLANGDRIQMGRSVLLFQLEGEAEPHDPNDRIDLIEHERSDDRSSIVGKVQHDARGPLLGYQPQLSSKGQDLQQSLANLGTLYRISEEVVSPATSLDQLLERILGITIEAVGADRGCVMIADPETGDLSPKVFSYGHGVDASEKMPVSRSIVDYVLQNRQGVCTSDARTDRRFTPGQSILQEGIREAMCVPMQGRYDLQGVVYVDTTTPAEQVILSGGAKPKFSEDQLRLLLAIGGQAALAIENNRYQEALLKAERLAAMGQTIAMLSHHIKNILQGIRGGSYLIDMGLKDHNEEFVKKGWGIVEKNQAKIYDMVMDMLTFSKERQPVLAPASLNETVSEVCELMQAVAAERGVQLERRFAAEIPRSSFDAEGIHRAVLNVLINAVDAVEGRERPAVCVQTGHDAALDTVFVAVIDNGPGIPPQQIPQIFNVFESTKGARGTGLGLPVSQKIIREHGGEIIVESKPGEGCRFVLSWPRIDGHQEALESQTRADAPPRERVDKA